jgi:integrase/recombinase XerD
VVKSERIICFMEAEKNYFADYLTYLRVERGLAENTIAAYQRDLLKLQQQALGQEKTLPTLERKDLVEIMRQSKEAGNSEATIARFISVAKGYYRFLLSEGLAKADPTTYLETYKSWQSLPKFLSLEEVDALLAQPDLTTDKGLRDRAILEVMYASGVRVTELITLKLADIDWEAGRMTCFGKGNKQRKVPLGRSSLEYLKRYMPARQRWLRGYNAHRLFIEPGGHALTRQKIWLLIKEYGKSAGIDYVTPHLLRHSFATVLMEHGADLRSVQLLLGHADIGTTEIYTHVTDAKMWESYRKFHPRS